MNGSAIRAMPQLGLSNNLDVLKVFLFKSPQQLKLPHSGHLRIDGPITLVEVGMTTEGYSFQ